MHSAAIPSASALPDPAQPSVVPFAGMIGLFLFAAWARLRRMPREDIDRAGADGLFVGVGIGLALYLTGLITGLY